MWVTEEEVNEIYMMLFYWELLYDLDKNLGS